MFALLRVSCAGNVTAIGMAHVKFTIGRSQIHGRGLFAGEAIAAGAHIGTFKGPATDSDGTHVLWLVDEVGRAEGRLGTNALKYVNHAAKPNAEFHDYELYALRDIAESEEITIDYGW